MLPPLSPARYSALPRHSEDELVPHLTTHAQSQLTGEPRGEGEEAISAEGTLTFSASETTGLINSTKQTKPITYLAAINQLFKPSVTLSLSSLNTVLQGIVNGIAVRHLSYNEMAAIPLAMASVAQINGLVQGTLYPTCVFVGELKGAQEKAKIGEIIAQGWWIGGALSLPTGLLLRNVSAFLNAFGISEEVSQAAQEYCHAISYGLMPLFLGTSDLLFAQGNKQPQIILAVNIVNAVLSMTLSYALALGAFGFPRLGIAGLGYGITLSAWLSFIGLRLYYKSSRQYDELKLFDLHLPNLKDISTLFKVGLPIGLNNVFASVNAVILSLLAGKLGKEVSVAQEVSSIPLSTFNILLMGLVPAINVEVSNAMGELKAALECHEEALIKSLQQNVKHLGNAGLIIGLALACCACLLFTGFSKQISEILLDTSQDIPKETLQLTQSLLFINSVGLIIDTLNSISTSNLLSMQDTLFALLLNAGGGLLGLSTGAYLSQVNKKAEWLFISQVLGSLIAALAITHRWLKKSNFNQNNNIGNGAINPRLIA